MAEPVNAGERTTDQPSQINRNPNKDKKQKSNNRRKNGKPASKKTTPEFKGSMAELNGHVFEVHSETTKTNQYSRSCEEIRKYVSRKYDYGGDMAKIIEDESELVFDGLKPVYPTPATIGGEIDKTDLRIWEKEVDEFVKRKTAYVQNKQALYMIIWGQCSDTMQARLRSLDVFEKIESNKDCLRLLKEIKGITYKFESQRYPFEATFESLHAFYQTRQHQHQTNADYLQKFRNMVNVLDHYKIAIGEDPVLIRDELKRSGIDGYENMTKKDEKYQAAIPKARERFIGYVFLRGSDPNRYSTLINGLSNQFTIGTDQYPDNLTTAYGMLVNFKTDKRKKKKNDDDSEKNEEPEMSFLNNSNKLDDDDKYLNRTNSSSTVNSYDSSNAAVEQRHREAVSFLISAADSKPDGSSMDIVSFDDVEDTAGDYNYSFLNPHETGHHHQNLDHVFVHLPYLNANWILLDTQSTVHIFFNKALLTGIVSVSEHESLTCYSNGGSQETHKKADFDPFGSVWYNPEALANILSFAIIADHYPVTYVQSKNIFTVTLPNGNIMPFIRSPRGLYYHDVRWDTQKCKDFVFVNTVADNMRVFSPRQIAAAERARDLYIMMARPSPSNFKYMLQHQLIKNTPVTYNDALRAETIFGPDLGSLKGKSVRSTPAPIILSTPVSIPAPIFEHHKHVCISADIFYMDGAMFFMTISRHLQFKTLHSIDSKKHDVIFKCFSQVIHTYKRRGFLVSTIISDHEFEPLSRQLLELGATLNASTADEHAPEIERAIRVIKERARSHLVMMPFSHYPKLLKRHLIHHLVTLVNLTVHPNSVSPYLSPATIVTGHVFDAQLHCRVKFGSYCQALDEPSPLNSVVKPRTLDTLALRPTGNRQGGFYFLHLTTWSIIERRKWTVIPMPEHIISLVNQRAIKESQPDSTSSLQFKRRDKSFLTSLAIDDSAFLALPSPTQGAQHGPTDLQDGPTDLHNTAVDGAIDLEPNNVNPDGNAPHTPTDDSASSADPFTSVDNETSSTTSSNHDDNDADTDIVYDFDPIEERPTENVPDNHSIQSAASQPSSDNDDVIDDIPPEPPPPIPINGPPDTLQATIQDVIDPLSPSDVSQRNSHAKDDINPEITEENIIDNVTDARPSTQRYAMRSQVEPRVQPHFSSKDGFTFAQFVNDLKSEIVEPKAPSIFSSRYGFAFTQMSAREGLRRFGERAANALITEWLQLDRLDVFEGVKFASITPENRKKALRLVQLIKEKRCGKIKGRTCADGRKQRSYIAEEDATSPTVHGEAVLISCMMDGHERRYVATADVPGAFLNIDIDGLVYVMVDGALVDILVRSNPKYKEFIHTTKNGKKIVYLRLKKALYGTITAARLFWENITGKLTKFGFKANRYDNCVMNMEIEGHQCTVLWHVDDLKVSHKHKHVVQRVLKYLEDAYGNLSVVEGKQHTYLGMNIDFMDDGSVEIDMKHYLEEAIRDFGETFDEREVSSPASPFLFEVDPGCVPLSEDKRRVLHSIVAKLLYVATKGRPDIYLPIAFLTSRVSKADEDDWKKLRRLLKYIQQTIDLKLVLRADNLTITKWWADAAYAVRDDGKSQTGMTMSLGNGVIMSKSIKQKPNTRSSTEAELVAASDALSQILWTRYFIEDQGYYLNDAVLYQDNKSAILLEKNGRLSSGKNTKHIHARYFFIKDKIDTGEVNVQYCPTGDMIADFFTKPLQGSQFTRFRDMILGITPIDYQPVDNPTQNRSVLEFNMEQ